MKERLKESYPNLNHAYEIKKIHRYHCYHLTFKILIYANEVTQ